MTSATMTRAWGSDLESKDCSTSDFTVHTLDQLPLEILYRVFYYLDIPDILRIRTVSRYLNRVSHCREIWSDTYRKVDLVRPPGPFLSQSSDELENVLVSSFRVERNLRHGNDTTWTERPTRRLKEVQYQGVDIRISLVFGRFLLIAFSQEVRCYDLNHSDSDASIVYRSTGGTLKSFHCVSAVDPEGHPFACVVLSEETHATTQISICLVNIGEQSEVALERLHQFEHTAFNIDAVDLGPRVIVIQGHGIRDRPLVAFDVHTRVQFLLPSFISTTWKATSISEFPAIEKILLPTSISTSTHLLLAYSFYAPPTGWKTFIQAFSLFPSETYHHSISGSTAMTLSFSHSGIIPGIYIGTTVLLHDSVRDPTTQDILIAIRVRAFEPSCLLSSVLKHGVLRLSSVHASSDHGSGIGSITFQLQGHLTSTRTPFLHPSFNGTGRVFHTLTTSSGCAVVALEYDLHARGDDDGHGAKVIECPCILRLPTPQTICDYDPYFGRICLRSAIAECNVIEVLDLAA